MGSGVVALVQSAEKACDLARANRRTSDLARWIDSQAVSVWIGKDGILPGRLRAMA
jgi:hypothetical protein